MIAMGFDDRRRGIRRLMSALIIILLLLALLVGGVGLFVEGLLWLLVISLVLFVVSGVVGFGRRGRV